MANLETLQNEPVMKSEVNEIEARTGYSMPRDLEIWSINYDLWSGNRSGSKTVVIIGKNYEDVESYLYNFYNKRNRKIQINTKEFKSYIHAGTPHFWKKMQECIET